VQTEINLLLGRSAGEKLGPPEELTPVFLTKSWDDVQTLTLQSSPEIRRSSAAVSRGKWSKRAAKMEYLPDFDISYRRKQMNDMWSGSDAMLGVSVPLWFWKQRAGVKQASAELTAAEAERKNTELMAVSRAKEVYTRLDATQRLIELYRASVIPKSEQSLTVAQSSFTGGKSSFLELLDSIRSYLELRLEYFNYIADYQKNRGALEKIVGTELWGDKS
jgi:cobalt-zinc-cadmium resistance protein CzcA